MAYRLQEDISFCQVEDHLIFLDIRNDRYFRLSVTMERPFLAFIEGGEPPGVELAPLIARNIITDAATTSTPAPTSVIKLPTRSAVELGLPKKTASLATMLDALAIVCLMQLKLVTRSLKTNLEALAAYRQRAVKVYSSHIIGTQEQRLLDTAAEFRHARLYIPIETCCLIDSLALTEFLAKRGLYADIVIGVTGDPFGGHCWVQSDDLVLNDTVGNASAHTPIRVV